MPKTKFNDIERSHFSVYLRMFKELTGDNIVEFLALPSESHQVLVESFYRAMCAAWQVEGWAHTHTEDVVKILKAIGKTVQMPNRQQELPFKGNTNFKLVEK
jgi:hypothetical protein